MGESCVLMGGGGATTCHATDGGGFFQFNILILRSIPGSVQIAFVAVRRRAAWMAPTQRGEERNGSHPSRPAKPSGGAERKDENTKMALKMGHRNTARKL